MREPGFIVEDLGTGKIRIYCAALLAARYDGFGPRLRANHPGISADA